MNAVLRTALAEGLGLAPEATDALSLVLCVSGTGWSHGGPGIRYFAYRDGEVVASVKQLPRSRQPDIAHVRECYERFAAADGFRVPKLLAAREDAEHFYLVEEFAAAPNLTTLVAAEQLSAAQAAEILERVLLAVWALSRPAAAELVERATADLRAAAAELFDGQPVLALVEGALVGLRAEGADGLRRTLTTRDITAANVLYDPDGTVWLTDFDLATETPFFGLDYYRAFFLSAPLQPPRPPAFLSPGAYRLCELLYPVFEYQIQAPHMPPYERERLRRYALDLFARLAMPAYHADATFRAELPAPARLDAQVFWAATPAEFSEADSLRFPFELRDGVVSIRAVVTPHTPVRYLRLDPIDTAGALVIVKEWRVAVESAGTVAELDVAALCQQGDDEELGHRVRLVNLRPLSASPGAYWSATEDPQIVAELPAIVGDAPLHLTVSVEIEVVREWKRRPGYEPIALLGPEQDRVARMEAAVQQARDEIIALRAEHRRAQRRERQLQWSAAPTLAPAAPLAARGLVRWPPPPPREIARQSLAIAAQLARSLGSRAIATIRNGSGSGAQAPDTAPHLAVRLVPAHQWPAPHVSILLLLDAVETGAREATVRQWLAGQSCQSAEIVVWSAATARAWDADHPHAPWAAESWTALRETLHGRYVAVASTDLVAQLPTYLETNLLALETEALCFTVNVHGDPTAALSQLAAGRTCGSATAPLLRQLARPECLTERLAVDVDACLVAHGGASAVVGRVITHPTADPDRAGPVPFDARLPGPAIIPIGSQLVASRADTAPALIDHGVALADELLRFPPLDCARPTVLVVFSFLAVGGAERVALDVMRQLKERIRFVVVAVEGHDPRLGTTADLFRAITPYVYTAPDFLLSPLNFSLFAYLIGRFAPQTLYIANGATWIYDALPTIKAHHPTLRTVNQVYDYAHGWIDRYDPVLVSALDAHIGCNARICDAYRARGAAAETVHLVPHGIDTADFDPARYSDADRRALKQQFQLPADRRVVSFLSRLHPQKRPMDFVELARQLAADQSLVFFMVGDGPLRSEVEDQIRRSGLTNMVLRRFHHPSRDLFAVSDVIVLPSAYEGMPLVVLESQAMGKPVVCTDVGNTREMIERTSGGVIVPAIGDVGALRAAVHLALEQPRDPQAMRAAVADAYGIATVADLYSRVLLGETLPVAIARDARAGTAPA